MKFTHDRVHECMVSMIGAKRASLHLRIGRIQCESLKDDSIDSLVLVAVDQVDRGILLVSERDELVALARVNLRAARVVKANPRSTWQ